ncbi:MAG: HypC/HybG/HupF family hydrogenase formation chaperone [Alphaproteobacteria bacterium]|nr:HypC/HybG/HupF family hydrogenase formation chaperone [Alphaproteobacteria bacterium]
MCMAIPSRIQSIENGNATVECFGETRVVSLMLLNEEVAPGDYVLVQAGGFAAEKVPAEQAEEALAVLADVLAGAAA